MKEATPKKEHYEVGGQLRAYLHNYFREVDLSVSYDDLRCFADSVPLIDFDAEDTLWETVYYSAELYAKLEEGLRETYVYLKTGKRKKKMDHLVVDRIDYCTFGNSNPFRIRILNTLNDNQDYYYVKRADASRVHGLELEDLLSPNRLQYYISGSTLVEEHIVGIPGDVFIEEWLPNINLSPVRLGKEVVKFSERCFVRLLGDMRPYNYVIEITPDFEDTQIRFRAMDFDQQSYHRRLNFYRPQFFKENNELSQFIMDNLTDTTLQQYRLEEYAMMYRRRERKEKRLEMLIHCMKVEPIAPLAHVLELRESLAEFYENDGFLEAEDMGYLVKLSLDLVCAQVA